MFNLPAPTTRQDDNNRIVLKPRAVVVEPTPDLEFLVGAHQRLHMSHGKYFAMDAVLAGAGFPHLSVTHPQVVSEDLHLRSSITHHVMHRLGYAPKQPPQFLSINDKLASVPRVKRVSKTRGAKPN